MTDHAITLETVDIDGAIREAEDAVAGDTRSQFFRKAALGGGALIGGGVLLSGFPALAAAAPSPKQDVAILNYALTLEYLEAAFYVEAVKKAGLDGALKRTAVLVRDHELAHVKAIKGVLGSKAVKSPRFDFKDTTSGRDKFVATAVVLEDTGVKAYSGQAGRIFAPAVLKAAVSILTVEARHAAAFRGFANKTPAPLAFDRSASMKQILAAVGKTGFIKD